MPGVALYKIREDYQTALGFLDDVETEVDAEAVEKLLAEVVDRFEDKAAAVCSYRAGLEAEADMIDNEIERLKKRATSLRNKGEAMKDYLEIEMRRCNLPEVKAGFFTVKFQKNPPSVDIAPGAAIPTEYMTIKPPPPPAPDKVKIKEAIQSGIEIPGCTLIQKETLRIK